MSLLTFATLKGMPLYMFFRDIKPKRRLLYWLTLFIFLQWRKHGERSTNFHGSQRGRFDSNRGIAGKEMKSGQDGTAWNIIPSLANNNKERSICRQPFSS